MAVPTVDLCNVMKTVTVEVKLKHLRTMRWRISIGSWLIWLGCLIMGVSGVEFVSDVGKNEPKLYPKGIIGAKGS